MTRFSEALPATATWASMSRISVRALQGHPKIREAVRERLDAILRRNPANDGGEVGPIGYCWGFIPKGDVLYDRDDGPPELADQDYVDITAFA